MRTVSHSHINQLQQAICQSWSHIIFWQFCVIFIGFFSRPYVELKWPALYNMYSSALVFIISLSFLDLSLSHNFEVPYQLRCTKTNLLEHNIFDTYKNEVSFKNSIKFLRSGKFTFDNYLHYLKSRKQWNTLDYSRKRSIENNLKRYIKSLDYDKNGEVTWSDFLNMSCKDGEKVDLARNDLQIMMFM